jgi:hypothetical protein
MKKSSWAIKNSSDNGKKKVFDHKPFEIGCFKFFPCNFSKSKKDGFAYFLLCRDRLGHVRCERISPKFKNKEEANNFVYKRTDFSVIPI